MQGKEGGLTYPTKRKYCSPAKDRPHSRRAGRASAVGPILEIVLTVYYWDPRLTRAKHTFCQESRITMYRYCDQLQRTQSPADNGHFRDAGSNSGCCKAQVSAPRCYIRGSRAQRNAVQRNKRVNGLLTLKQRHTYSVI